MHESYRFGWEEERLTMAKIEIFILYAQIAPKCTSNFYFGVLIVVINQMLSY